jgi:alkaline phosphatase D
VLHLGDYLYEYKNGRYGDGTALNRVPKPDKEMVTLKDYRIRHAQYKADFDSQAMLRQHPLIAVWDDHESANNSWMDGAENHDPDQGEGDWFKRRVASVKAYYEWMPIRENRSARQLQIYRSFRYGNLVDLIMLDTRLTGRDEQVDRDNNQAVQDSNRSLLGDTQEAWLFGELEESIKNGTQWRVLGQQVFFGPQAPSDEILNSDVWDGYQGNRNRIFDFIEKYTLENLVVLTGDIHSSWALDVPRDPWGSYDPTTGLGSLAVEFVTPAVSSPSQFTTRPQEADAAHQARMAASPHLKFVDQVHRGYFILDITPERAQADWYFVSTVATRSTEQRFVRGFYTTAGSNHLIEATRPIASRLDVPLLAP